MNRDMEIGGDENRENSTDSESVDLDESENSDISEIANDSTEVLKDGFQKLISTPSWAAVRCIRIIWITV